MICKGHGCIRNDGSNWVKFLSGGCFLFEKNIYFLLNLISAQHCWRKKNISSDFIRQKYDEYITLSISSIVPCWMIIHYALEKSKPIIFFKIVFQLLLTCQISFENITLPTIHNELKSFHARGKITSPPFWGSTWFKSIPFGITNANAKEKYVKVWWEKN